MRRKEGRVKQNGRKHQDRPASSFEHKPKSFFFNFQANLPHADLVYNELKITSSEKENPRLASCFTAS